MRWLTELWCLEFLKQNILLGNFLLGRVCSEERKLCECPCRTSRFLLQFLIAAPVHLYFTPFSLDYNFFVTNLCPQSPKGWYVLFIFIAQDLTQLLTSAWHKIDAQYSFELMKGERVIKQNTNQISALESLFWKQSRGEIVTINITDCPTKYSLVGNAACCGRPSGLISSC